MKHCMGANMGNMCAWQPSWVQGLHGLQSFAGAIYLDIIWKLYEGNNILDHILQHGRQNGHSGLQERPCPYSDRLPLVEHSNQ